MTSNRFILNRLTLSLLLAASLPITLVGCQSNNSNDVTMPEKPTNAENIIPLPVPAPIQPTLLIQAQAPTKATTLQWASHYQWQLAQAKNPQGNLININTANLITLAVAPSSLSLSQGCQHFSIDFGWMEAPPFEYGSELRERPFDCKNNPEYKINKNKGDIDALFPKNGILKLGITLSAAAKNEPKNTQMAAKNLVIKIEHGNTLVFTGTSKTFKTPTGLAIDNALLERYNWRLKSAIRPNFDDNGKIISRRVISDFYHPEFPVTLQFTGHPDGQYASFRSNCNGIGGPYILMTDHTLLVGSGIQTVMGCGVTGNKIENELSKLVSNSKSTLSLSLQPSSTSEAQSKNQTNFPRYNLLQTFDSGETSIWQNTVKETP